MQQAAPQRLPRLLPLPDAHAPSAPLAADVQEVCSVFDSIPFSSIHEA